MGEKIAPIRAKFNGSIRVEARPERLTSEAGVLALREAFDRLEMVKWLKERVLDNRNQDYITYPVEELIMTSILLLTLGYRDHDDADRLRNDAVLRLSTSTRKGIAPLEVPFREEGIAPPKNPEYPEHLPSQPTLSRLTNMLSSNENRKTLREGLLELAARRMKAVRGNRYRYLTLDIDSLPIEVHGKQPEAKYNGHYHSTIYHPLVASVAQTGDLLDVDLRRGNAYTAEGGLEFIESLINRVENKLCQVAAVRIDAGFPEENLLSGLEAKKIPFVARLKNNAVLDKMAENYLWQTVGRREEEEPRIWTYEMSYQAKSWSRQRRVVLVVVEEPGESFPRHFWLITSWTCEQMSGIDLLKEYRQRGTAEGHMGELMSVIEPMLSSSPRPKESYSGRPIKLCNNSSVDSFAVNEVRLLLCVWAYNLMHVGRTLMEKATGIGWGLQRFRERCLKIASRIQIHGRRATFIISDAYTKTWNCIWKELSKLSIVFARQETS